MSLISTLQRGLRKVARNVDADTGLQVAMGALVERARSTYPTMPHARWRQGEPLRLLFAGYSGTRNTGADVRVEEMIRQFRHVLGEDNLDLSIHVQDAALTAGYFRTVKHVVMPRIFPKFLYDEVAQVHGVVACEGSMFKSKFASALSTYMAGALGLAAASHKLSIAYGGEAGDMTDSLKELVKRSCDGAFVITRNENSRKVLGELGLKTKLGTDTAWTFQPAPSDVGRKLLMDAGWDGVTPVLALCPINPFWWPVRPDLGKGVSHALLGTHGKEHYASIYFHKGGHEVEEKQRVYLDAMAEGARRFARHQDVFMVCIGSEQLDREACEGLSERLDGAPVFVSDQLEMFEMVSLMRQATYMVSSRYHACVMTMPAGVLSVGVTMDERIANLMADRGTPELSLRVDDPELAGHIEQALLQVHRHPEATRRGIEACVVRNLEMMGRMGQMLADYVRDQLPGFPLPEGRGRRGDVWDHLPPLSPELHQLISRHRSAP